MECAELYTHVPLPGLPIPIEVSPFTVDDNIPGEEEIAEAVLWLWIHHSGGPYGMRAKHLMIWIHADMWDEHPGLGNCDKVVSIIQENFRGG